MTVSVSHLNRSQGPGGGAAAAQRCLTSPLGSSSLSSSALLGCISSCSRGPCAVLVWWPALPKAQVLSPGGISVVPPLQARRAQELWRWRQAENPRLEQGRAEPWEWAVPGPQPRRAAAQAVASRAFGRASQSHRRQNPPLLWALRFGA